MSYKYTRITEEPGIRSAGGWTHQRGWRNVEEGSAAPMPVMMHTLHVNNPDHEMLLSRYYEEIRRVLFKASNLPEASHSTVCLDRAYKEQDDSGKYRYHVITRGWYSVTLHDLFAPDGNTVAEGNKWRKNFKFHGKRVELWHGLAPLAKMLKRLQQSRLFCPALTLHSFCFLAETEETFHAQENGQFDFENLRLCELENIVPFGNLFDVGRPLPTSLQSIPPIQVALWRSFAEMVVDIFATSPPSSWTQERKQLSRLQQIEELHSDDSLIFEEYDLLRRMLRAEDMLSLGNVCRSIDEICAILPVRSEQKSEYAVLNLVYNPDNFKELVEYTEYQHTPTEEEIQQAISACITNADLLYSVADLSIDESCKIYFDCGDGIWFVGKAFYDKYRKQTTTRRLFLDRAYRLNGNTAPPVKLYGANLHFVSLCNMRRCRDASFYSDWVTVLKRNAEQARAKRISDAQLTILASLELNNQLESLMGFLYLCLFKLEAVNCTDSMTTLTLRPYRADMLESVPESLRESVSEILTVQKELRAATTGSVSYEEFIFEHFKEQYERMSSAPEDQQKQADLMLAKCESAGSLSLNVLGGKSALDLISWQVNWDRVYESQGMQIVISRVTL